MPVKKKGCKSFPGSSAEFMGNRRLDFWALCPQASGIFRIGANPGEREEGAGRRHGTGHSERITRGTECVSRARSGLWELQGVTARGHPVRIALGLRMSPKGLRDPVASVILRVATANGY